MKLSKLAVVLGLAFSVASAAHASGAVIYTNTFNATSPITAETTFDGLSFSSLTQVSPALEGFLSTFTFSWGTTAPQATVNLSLVEDSLSPAVVTGFRFREVGASSWQPGVMATPTPDSFGVGSTSVATLGNFSKGHSYELQSLTAFAAGTAASGVYTLTVTPVPEPESYAMLLAGLGLMAGVARRRAALTK